MSEQTYRDIIGLFAAAQRETISPELESRLRAARYLPTDDPSEISAERWRIDHGVTYFELKRLQEIYDTYVRITNYNRKMKIKID
jgi:hypothetical protein